MYFLIWEMTTVYREKKETYFLFYMEEIITTEYYPQGDFEALSAEEVGQLLGGN